MSLSPAQRRNIIYEIIANLEGSQRPISDIVDSHGLSVHDLSDEENILIDNNIKLCETCGFWVSLEDMGSCNEGQICQECEDNV